MASKTDYLIITVATTVLWLAACKDSAISNEEYFNTLKEPEEQKQEDEDEDEDGEPENAANTGADDDDDPDPAPLQEVDSAPFDCLESAVEVNMVSLTTSDKFTIQPFPGRAFDARGSTFTISDVTHGMIVAKGNATQKAMCWAGGFVTSDKALDVSWDHWKSNPPNLNSAAINIEATEFVVTGLHFYNVGDGLRMNNAKKWAIKHVWGEYIRDDCIENDRFESGVIVDSLFDGCYGGISTRSSHDEDNGIGKVIEFDRVLMRMEASPYPYKYNTKHDIIAEDGSLWQGEMDGIPYGHGHLFKIDSNNIARNAHFRIRNSTFVFAHENIDADKLSFPPISLIDECVDVTVIWLGEGAFPGTLPGGIYADCVTLISGPPGEELWAAKVADWHERNPGVGAGRVPAQPGKILFPRHLQ